MTVKASSSYISSIDPTLLQIFDAQPNAVEDFRGTADKTDIVSYKNSATAVGAVLYSPSDINWNKYISGWAVGDTFGTDAGATNPAGADWIDGVEGTRFADQLYGNDHNNFFIGGAGADTVHGGGGIDTLSFETAVSGIVFSNSYYDPGKGDAAGDQISGVENFIGSNFGDDITGNSVDNYIDGGKGNDTLDGVGGADTLDGGSGIDTADYSAHIGAIKVNLLPGAVNEGYEADGDVLLNIENLTGTKWGDTLTGDDGNNVINGGLAVEATPDTLIGKGGNDIYYVDDTSFGGHVTKIIEEAGAGSGTDLAYTKVSYTLAANVENLTALPGQYEAVRLTGNNLANKIIGNQANNIINGGTGADVMEGGSGSDTYYVDNAKDVVKDTSGTDTVYTSVSYTLASALDKLKAKGTAGISLSGNVSNNTIMGNDGANKINGGKGKDVLTGDAGKDTFIFDTSLSKTSNVDRITDFSVRYDTVQLDNAIFKQLGSKTGTLNSKFFTIGSAAKDSSDHIIYDNKKGYLYYDADGSGKGAATLFATLKKDLGLTHKDFYVI